MPKMKITSTPSYEIMSDGKTVWVNHQRGQLIGRFSRTGIDIHRDFSDHKRRYGEHCLDCKPGPTNHEDWNRFKNGMKQFHEIVIPDKHMPKFLETKVD